ncbi:GDSL esterase/lipase [Vitis vinifera]|uniref:GDSL esterase/lipase n=1 Tax=Vitis vinifera TaxID=29760 RepID=A0A438KBD0_VITVI|nr:GDSL esterase/lipase [Vitis vinifera]
MIPSFHGCLHLFYQFHPPLKEGHPHIGLEQDSKFTAEDSDNQLAYEERVWSLGSTKPPVATTVFFGANDAALAGRTSERQHVPVEEYKENLRRIVHHLKVQIPHFMPLDPGPSEVARGLDRSVRGISGLTHREESSGVLTFKDQQLECSSTMLVVLVTPPPVDEEGRMQYAKKQAKIIYKNAFLLKSLRGLTLDLGLELFP